jgi:hypothetical protein
LQAVINIDREISQTDLRHREATSAEINLRARKNQLTQRTIGRLMAAMASARADAPGNSSRLAK